MAQDAAKIGYIINGPDKSDFEQGFEAGLREGGYEIGRNATILYRSQPKDPSALRSIFEDFVQQDVGVIVVGGAGAARAAQSVTTTIPIVFTTTQDAVGDGLVQSLAQPGGNMTGQSVHAPELSAKRVELLAEAVPGLDRVAVVWNKNNPRKAQLDEAVAAGRALGIGVDLFGISIPDELDDTMAKAIAAGADGMFFVSDTATVTYRNEIGEAALRHRMPTMLSNSTYLQGGGMMSYGPDIVDIYRRSALQVAKILDGARPETLPVEQPTKFVLAINLRTVRALGLELPPTLIARADEMIE